MLAERTTYDLSHSSEPMFQPVATGTAKTADEALEILARERNDLADQEHACHKAQGGMDENDPRFDELPAPTSGGDP